MPMLQRLPKWFDPRLYGAPSRIHGHGVLTRAPVQPGEVLMRWGGIVLPVADFDPARYRLTSTTHYDEAHCLTTPIEEPVSLDELLNHSCDPNLWLVDAVTVVARRSIAAGEEVHGDFATWEDSEHVLTADCRCGAPLCRRRITGRDWRLPELQARYAGHFLPYLNRAMG